MHCLIALLIAGASLVQADTAPESTHRIDAEDSIIGFVTYKAGIASVLVDNALVYPAQYTTLFIDRGTPESVNFSLRIESASLTASEAAVQKRWYPRLHELSILEQPLKEASESRRKRTRNAIVSERLLNAAAYPYIEAKTRHVTKDADGPATHFHIGLDVTIRGVTVPVEWPATIMREGGRIVAEIHGPLKFSDFGIDPYSTLFGAVRYRDDFQVYARLVAVPVEPPAGAPHP